MTGEPTRPVRVLAALLLAAFVPLLGARLYVAAAEAACSPSAAHACCCPDGDGGCPGGGCCHLGPARPVPAAVLADVGTAPPPAGAALAAAPAGPDTPARCRASLRVPPRARSAPLFVLNAALLI